MSSPYATARERFVVGNQDDELSLELPLWSVPDTYCEPETACGHLYVYGREDGSIRVLVCDASFTERHASMEYPLDYRLTAEGWREEDGIDTYAELAAQYNDAHPEAWLTDARNHARALVREATREAQHAAELQRQEEVALAALLIEDPRQRRLARELAPEFEGTADELARAVEAAWRDPQLAEQLVP